jgi:sugar phosphate isomerase/epimerase
MAERIAGLGLDGVDLLVRDGTPVVPGAPHDVAAAADRFRRADLRLDMVTTDLLEPGEPAWALLGACAWAGVPLVRLGFYRYDAALGYSACRERARRCLAAFAEYAERAGVVLALQLHQGTIHASAALAAALLDGLGPAVGIYADPGNQVKEGGEDWRLTLDIAGAGLRCIGVKNAGWYRGEDGWRAEWVRLGEGIVPWAAVLAHLRDSAYDGVISLHTLEPADVAFVRESLIVAPYAR